MNNAYLDDRWRLLHTDVVEFAFDAPWSDIERHNA